MRTHPSCHRLASGVDRRQALGMLAGGCAAVTLGRRGFGREREGPRSQLGLVIYCQRFRREWVDEQDGVDLFEPLRFLQHCHVLNAGGMQAALGVLEAPQIQSLRDFADEHGLFIDAIIRSPRDDSDESRFEAEVRTAAAVGVRAARTVIMPGRRYEQFSTLDEFREAARRGQRALERAAPIVERHRVRLAVENHKDQRIDERLALFEHLDCEYIGACVDTGNSFALLDDPYGAVEALAPYAFTVHLKDQAVLEYDEGFLLADVSLGDGCFDLKRMVDTLRRVRPEIPFALELITRDPLRVPCLTDAFFATMPQVPARDLVRTLRIVRSHPAATLPQVSSLPLQQQVTLELANVTNSLQYAYDHLGLRLDNG